MKHTDIDAGTDATRTTTDTATNAGSGSTDLRAAGQGGPRDASSISLQPARLADHADQQGAASKTRAPRPTGSSAEIVPLFPQDPGQPRQTRLQVALSRQWAEMRRDIEAALHRVDEGSAGYCQICGDRIDDAHRNAQPASPFCRSCATG
ncbi:TraR/DksA C4-type zinc finger protein [Phaeobacter sp.]|uniref:TraR/DksA family transcriptional regulator n=1 Tax=Phaeobacter sp. TaxID=1902409 RepID=UPI0025F01FA5|nr:TraR/DksA C4-type zinc finger protein [Phaeobacter sp.]